MASKIGAITVGQSPRNDVTGEIENLLDGVELIQRGALDGLTTSEIAALAPQAGDYVLVTRLADGTSVRIAKKYILERMQYHIDDLMAQGIDGILLLCTGDFPAFTCPKPVLYPQKLLQYFVAATCADQVVGVLIPDSSQIPQSTARWMQNGVKQVRVEPATPYGNPEEVILAAQRLHQQGAAVIIMDCIGYTEKMKEEIKKQTGLPVVLPRSVAARSAAELFATKG